MIIRQAFFRGKPKPGQEAAFERCIADELVPLWRRFPGALEVRVLRPRDADPAAPAIALILAITYPDQAAIDALAHSSVRAESKTATARLLDMLDGELFHVNFAVDDLLAGNGHTGGAGPTGGAG